MNNDVGMVNGTEIAVALGRVEENVKHIRDNTEKRLANAEQFQLTARAEFTSVRSENAELGSRVTAVETSLATSVKWLTVLMSVVAIVVTVILKFT